MNKKKELKKTEEKTQCVVCGKEIKILEEFNGEMMCQSCYKKEENEVFTDE